MPSVRLIPRVKANVRWNRELECFEMYCPDCPKQFKAGQVFWPLDSEFWDINNLQRCRACNAKIKRDYLRKRRRDDPDFRQRSIAQSREIRGYRPAKCDHA